MVYSINRQRKTKKEKSEGAGEVTLNSIEFADF